MDLLLSGRTRKRGQVTKAVDDLSEATRELPDINEKIRSFEKGDEGGGGEALRKEHERRSLRSRENQFVDGIRTMYSSGIEAIDAVVQDLKQRFEDILDVDLAATPNREIIEKLRDAAQTAIETSERHLDGVKDVLTAAQTDLKTPEAQLSERQALQEKQYRELVDAYELERAKGEERTRFEQRHAELKSKEKKLNEKTALLDILTEERDALRTGLSDLRDERYRHRLAVAERLNEHLSPMIRVRVEQFGNMDEYRTLLTQSMKGSGLRYAAIVDRAVERIPPAELAALAWIPIGPVALTAFDQ